MFVLKIRLYNIIVCSCLNNIFPNITEIIFDYKLCFMATSVYTIVTVHWPKIDTALDQPLHHSYVMSSI